MLNNTDKIRVENRGRAIVAYRVPESNVIRRFVAGETKEITMGELRQAVQIPGIYRLIESNLIIHNKEAVSELLPNVEPEYFYNAQDVDFLLRDGTLDQLKDALDFAPEGVINLIKDQAVKTELNDIRKREAILVATKFDVTKAIEINHLSETENKAEVKTRRTTPIGEENISNEVKAPARRAVAPQKYTVINKTE